MIDAATRTIRQSLEVFRSPHGISFTEDGAEAWVSHLFAGGGLARLSRIDLGRTEARVTAEIPLPEVAAGRPEGGHPTIRGHHAPIPGAGELWLPSQLSNTDAPVFTPDSTIQAEPGFLRAPPGSRETSK